MSTIAPEEAVVDTVDEVRFEGWDVLPNEDVEGESGWIAQVWVKAEGAKGSIT